MKILSILFFIAVTFTATAQEYVLYAAPVAGKKAIQLKWLSKNPLKDKAFTVYRKTGTLAWEKVNTAPIIGSPVISEKDLSTAKNPFPGDSLYTAYIKMKNFKADDAVDLQNIDFILYFSATTNNRLAYHIGIYFEDLTVQPGITYEYKVAVDEGGSIRDLATSEHVSLETVLSTPANLEAIAADSAIHLKWEYDQNFIFYKVHTKANATAGAIALPDGAVLVTIELDDKGVRKLPEHFFTHPGLLNGTTYYYQISGIDFFGAESPLSNPAKATPRDMTPPMPIKGFKATKEQKEVKLSWDMLKDNDLQGYNVYRSHTIDSNYAKVNSTTLNGGENKFTDKPEAEGGTVYYYIEAIDKSGNKSNSAPKGIFFPDLTPPKTPSGLIVLADTGLIQLSWKKNMEADIMGYRVYRALENNPNDYNLLMLHPISENMYTDSQPAQSRNKFMYRITAVDKSYNESPFVYAEANMPDIVPPSPPLITYLEYKEGSVVIKWKNQAEPDIKTFHVFRKREEETSFTEINKTPLPLSQFEYRDNTVRAGQKYTYAIRTMDSAGLLSEYSISRSIAVPSPLDTSIALIANLKADYDSLKQETLITFSYPKTTDGILGFLIMRSTAEGDFYPVCSPQKATRFVDTGLQQGETYYYKIAIMTEAGELKESMDQVRVEIK